MTATDELRRLLDERGVEHRDHNDWATTWLTPDSCQATACEDYAVKDWLRLEVVCITPAQAVEATLGRGECKLVPTRDKPRSKAPTLTFSECGWWTDEIGKAWNYCPSCGRKVVG